jgi:hypothetical protein
MLKPLSLLLQRYGLLPRKNYRLGGFVFSIQACLLPAVVLFMINSQISQILKIILIRY